MTRTCSAIFMMVASSAWLAACAQPAEEGVSTTNPMSSTGPMPAVVVDAGLASAAPAQPGPVGPAVFSPVADSGSAVYTIDTKTMGFEDGGCGASAVEAKQVVIKEEKVVEEKIDEVQPVALYIMLDQSASMVQQGLWVPARDALKAFVTDPKSTGIDVALQFFPAFDFIPFINEVCDGTGLDTPAVAMGRLPAHAANVTQALDGLQPSGIGTPIEAALRGASNFCKRFEQTSMGEKCVAVLVTDGAPMGCQGGQNELVQIAQMNYAAGMGPRTFTVGLQGADFTLLDGLAQAGGAIDCDMNSERFACDVSGGPNLLGAALHKIRDVVTTVKTRVETTTHVQDIPVECEWTIPTPPAGGTVDKKRVNVRVSAPKLPAPIDFGQVEDAAACVEKGWHYDDPNAPTRLVACPQTCTMLKATPQARVDILLGCATVTLR
jgi:hypothetical protein